MSVSLQVFFKHCFCGAYSTRFRPTAGDVTTCPCTFTQMLIPMVDLDDDGDPWPKAEGDRDSTRGRSVVAQPHTVPPQNVSIPPADFQALMSGFHDNPRRTPLHSPAPFTASQRHAAPRRPAHPPLFSTLLHISYLIAPLYLFFVIVS